MKKADTG